jgi:hypothetical protein
MQGLAEANISCPYCGEVISVLIDDSIEEQQYIEDCQVCCHPIVFITRSVPGEPPQIEVRREDDG